MRNHSHLTPAHVRGLTVDHLVAHARAAQLDPKAPVWVKVRQISQAIHVQKRAIRDAMDLAAWKVHGHAEESTIGGWVVARLPLARHTWRIVGRNPKARPQPDPSVGQAARDLRAGTTRPCDSRPPRGPYGKTRP